MSIFSRKAEGDREFELRAEVARLTDRCNRLERVVGSAPYSMDSYTFLFGSSYVGPTVHERISAITNHLNIEIVGNPESHAKWVARKVGAKK